MNLKSIWLRTIIIILPLITIGLVFFFKQQLYDLGNHLPSCPSYTYLHLYCPGCGNTRSVQHLLTGDIAGSMRYNPIPLFGIVVLLMAYIELSVLAFNRTISLIPRNKLFWGIIVLIFAVYFIIRNIYKIL